MADEAVAEVWTFPTEISKFDDDERISFSKLDGKYIAVQEDGAEFEFDSGLKRWIPHDEEMHEQIAAIQQTAYAADDRDLSIRTVGNARAQHESAAATRQGTLKRKQDQTYGQHEPRDPNTRTRGQPGNDRGNANKRAKAQQPSAASKPKQPKQNTAVYVTGLPQDATVDEVAELFSRKCGVIAEEIDSGRPRIKMYSDSEGRFKGDALVVFFKPQSVDMALMLLDDTDFRFGVSNPDGTRMRVQAADASYKKTSYEGQSEAKPEGGIGADRSGGGGGGGGGNGGGGGGGGAGGGRPRGKDDKQKIIKKTQKLDAKLADWSSDEEDGGRRRFAAQGGPGGSGGSSKWDKVVILQHMFTLQELDEDPAALLEIKEDIREECAKLGDVTNVVLFDLEPEGVVSVKFKTVEAAAACVRMMHGRAFDGRTVEARVANGREKYKKSKKDGNEDEE